MAEFLTDEELTRPDPDTIGGVLFDFGNEMQEELRKALRNSDSYVSGDLAEQIDFNVKVFGSTITFQLSLLDYYDYVNKGVSGTEVKRNSPYRFGSKMPPVSKLERWVNDKGIARGAERKSVAFAISKSIQKKGTKGNHFYDKVVTTERLKQLQRDLAKAASKNVSTIITDTANGIFGITRK